MRNFPRTRAIVLAFLVVAGCASDQRQNAAVNSAPETPHTLVAHRTFGDSAEFSYPAAVEVSGDRLLVADLRTDPHISIIDLRTGAVTARVGRDGRGPHEFVNPMWFTPQPHSRSQVWIYDFVLRRLALLDLDRVDQAPISREVTLKVGVSLRNPTWLDDTTLLSNGAFPVDRLVRMDTGGKVTWREMGGLPFMSADSSRINGLDFLNTNSLARAPDGRFAMSYLFANRIDLFSSDGAFLKSFPGRAHQQPAPSQEGGRWHHGAGARVAYPALAATNDRIYAAFGGYPADSLGLPHQIHVFDWDGRLVSTLKLDHPVFSITVADGRLFGAVLEPYPGVVEWELPRED